MVAKLEEVYGDDVEQLDLMIGTLAEGPRSRPTNFGFGETMFQIFILNASRRLQADRFYTDDYREEVYTAEGMAWIDDSSFKKVILRHFPELAATGLGNIKNAFEPWDTDAELDPDRHPLRAFDPELKAHPEQGDAATTPVPGGDARPRSDSGSTAGYSGRSPPRASRISRCGRSRSSDDHLDVEPLAPELPRLFGADTFPRTEHADVPGQRGPPPGAAPSAGQPNSCPQTAPIATDLPGLLDEIYPERYRENLATAPDRATRTRG